MRKIKFPTWFEPETVRYISAHFGGEHNERFCDNRDKGGNENCVFFPEETPRDYLISPHLKLYWLRMKERYPSEPAAGQIEFFRMIESSFPNIRYKWTTKVRAGKWEKRFLSTLDKLERLWDEIPSNFVIKPIDSQNYIPIDELHKTIPGMEELKAVIKQFECVEPVYGRQTVGQKAVKRYFIRELTRQFVTVSGASRPGDVAYIASQIYGVTVTAANVKRATQDLEKYQRQWESPWPWYQSLSREAKRHSKYVCDE